MRSYRRKLSIILLIIAAFMIIVAPLQLAKAQDTTTISVSPQTTTASVGQTVSVKIDVTDVQGLYALDLNLDYNSSVLQLTSAQPDLGTNSIASGGVLYGNPLTTNINNLQSGGLYYNSTISSGSYELIATSAASEGFSGSGTIVTLKFTVTNTGQSNITIIDANETLANDAALNSGDTSEYITPVNAVNGLVNATASSTSSSNPFSTNFLLLLIIIVIIAVIVIAVAITLSRRKPKVTNTS